MLIAFLSGMTAYPGLAAQDGVATPSSKENGESRGFAFYPAETGFGTYFDLTLEPGESTQLKVLLANTGTVMQELRAYPSNAFTAEGGGLAIAGFGDETSGPTQWLSLEADVYTVEPGNGVESTFTLAVPEDAEPGQYVTAVVGENAEPRPVEGVDIFDQTIRYAIPIFITIPGETEATIDITNLALEARDDLQILNISMTNTGDVHLHPEGEIQIRDADDNILATVPVGMGTFYARDSTVLSVAIPVTKEMGVFSLTVQLHDSATGAEASAEVTDLVAQSPATPVPPPPVSITATTVAPQPSADNVQFAVVEATISNTAEPIDAQLSLLSYLDGEEVERFPISQSLSVPQGDTPITTRYIPIDGWTSGEWTFELLLETIDPATGAAVVMDSQPLEGAISIP